MPAMTMVLHTWTRQLAFHPHVHTIVSAGGLTEEGTWKASRSDYLFPVKVMARLFRRLLRERLLGAIDAGELHIAEELTQPMRRALFSAHAANLVECLLALTGVDLLRCPRCAGHMRPVALELAASSHRRDTS
jgi:hypothetical protein